MSRQACKVYNYYMFIKVGERQKTDRETERERERERKGGREGGRERVRGRERGRERDRESGYSVINRGYSEKGF